MQTNSWLTLTHSANRKPTFKDKKNILQNHLSQQARNQGGARGAFAPPPPQQAPKVHILILNIQVKECSPLNWSFKLNSDI